MEERDEKESWRGGGTGDGYRDEGVLLSSPSLPLASACTGRVEEREGDKSSKSSRENKYRSFPVEMEREREGTGLRISAF